MTEQPPHDPSQQPPVPPVGPPPWSYGYPPPRPTAGGAVTALVLGILGLVMCGPFTAIPAIVVGRRATREIDASQGQLDGRSTAQAGVVLGVIGTVLGGLALLFVIFVFVLGGLFAINVDHCASDSDGFIVQCE